MFAIGAFLCFLLALIGIPSGKIDLVILGLMFIALHMIAGSDISLPWLRRRV